MKGYNTVYGIAVFSEDAINAVDGSWK